jgi:hypothetical protein
VGLLRISCLKQDEADLTNVDKTIDVDTALREVAGLVGLTPEQECDIFVERARERSFPSEELREAAIAELYQDYGVRPPKYKIECHDDE